MKFYEALRLAQEENKKIRLTRWNADEYIYFKEKEFFVGGNNTPYRIIDSVLVAEWEVYEPLVAFAALKPGDTFRIKDYKTIFHKIQLMNNEFNAVSYTSSYAEVEGKIFKADDLVIFNA